jgi:hypothetical protein
VQFFQSSAWETRESRGNFHPKIVDVSVEIRTGHILITSQALLLDRTCFCNQKCAFGAALLGELYGVKQQEYGDSMSVRPSVVSKRLSELHEIWWKTSSLKLLEQWEFRENRHSRECRTV